MYFKDELPPPRYALDGDFADSELPFTEEHELIISDFSLNSFDLVLLAPKCTSLLTSKNGCDPAQFGTAVLKSVTKPRMQRTNPDFYEAEADDADFVRTESNSIEFHRLISAKQPTMVGFLPALSSSQAAFAGKHLIKRLLPRSLTLITPGQSFMDTPVCYLATPQHPHVFKLSSSLNVLRARPPVLVQGIGAASVSQAQQLGIPALALVLSSDGPVNHEILADGGLNLALEALSLVVDRDLNPAAKIEREISELYV